MNWIDFSLLFIFLVSIITDWFRGFIMGTLDLLAWISSFVLAYLFYADLSVILDSFFNLGVWLLPVSFLTILVIARLLTGLVIRTFMKVVPEAIHRSGINKFMGIIPGAVNGLLYTVIIAALLLALPLSDSITTETRESKLAGRLAMKSEWVNRKLAPVFDQAVRHTMNSLTVQPTSHDKVSLSFTTNTAKIRPFLEMKMLELVNQERAKEGLPLLRPDPELTQVARAHSRDMFQRGYFAHENPDGKDPFDRMKEAGVSFSAAGENLALAQTLEIAHSNLMKSPGHRANILNPSFGRLGIGILDGGFYGLMISQEFRN